ncbi:MAG: hypothetical protein ACI4TU_09335 [Candidatus Cryptobacteroides sp.]
MTLLSCNKIEQGEDSVQRVVKIDVPEYNTVHVYRDEPYEFRFTVDETCLPASARVMLADGLQAKVIVNSAGEGTLVITTEKGGTAQVNVYNRTSGCIFNVTASLHTI